jgi:hypothetical protein
MVRSQIRPVPSNPVVLAGNDGSDLKRSPEEIREMWMRLLIYAAGKCSGELQRGNLAKEVSSSPLFGYSLVHQPVLSHRLEPYGILTNKNYLYQISFSLPNVQK